MNFVYLLSPGGLRFHKIDGVSWANLRDSPEFREGFYETDSVIRFRGSPFKCLEIRGSYVAGRYNRVASMICGQAMFGNVYIVYDSPSCKVVENAAVTFLDGICSLLAPLAVSESGEYDVDVFMLRAGYDKIINGLDRMIEAENNCEEWEDCFNV